MARQYKSKPILDDLETWLHAQLPKISGKSPLAGAIRYALTLMKKLRLHLGRGQRGALDPFRALRRYFPNEHDGPKTATLCQPRERAR